ncbi:MAG: alpha/beta hydrolase [Rectinemataceae bacterium]
MARQPIVIGHSAGGAATLSGLVTGHEDLDAAVLLAPLVRPAAWYWAFPLAYIASPFVRDLPPRGYEEGFLGVSRLPLSWINALARWQPVMMNGKPRFQGPLLLIQGGLDSLVDNDYSKKLISRLWPNSEYLLVPYGGHILFDLRSSQAACVEAISAFLDRVFP